MHCTNCGAPIKDGAKFCAACGAPQNAAPNPPQNATPGVNAAPNAAPQQNVYVAPQPAPAQQAQFTQPAPAAPKKKKTWLIVLLIVLGAVTTIAIIIGILVFALRRAAEKIEGNFDDLEYEYDDYEYDFNDDSDMNALDGYDQGSMDEALDALDNLDLDIDSEPDEPAMEPNGDVTMYSYADVTRDGNLITVTPNGGLNGSTKLYNGKDLDGFLDYVDSDVLEEGRKINREFFYGLLATMLVDKDLNPDFVDDIEKNMMMALAMANNFHDMPVTVNSCDLDANNAVDYHFNVTAYGKDDTWIVDFNKRTMFMNNGSTEYHSNYMFEDEYLAVWLVAIDEYYGSNSLR